MMEIKHFKSAMQDKTRIEVIKKNSLDHRRALYIDHLTPLRSNGSPATQEISWKPLMLWISSKMKLQLFPTVRITTKIQDHSFHENLVDLKGLKEIYRTSSFTDFNMYI